MALPAANRALEALKMDVAHPRAAKVAQAPVHQTAKALPLPAIAAVARTLAHQTARTLPHRQPVALAHPAAQVHVTEVAQHPARVAAHRAWVLAKQLAPVGAMLAV